jgi:hypothetical protein
MWWDIQQYSGDTLRIVLKDRSTCGLLLLLLAPMDCKVLILQLKAALRLHKPNLATAPCAHGVLGGALQEHS